MNVLRDEITDEESNNYFEVSEKIASSICGVDIHTGDEVFRGTGIRVLVRLSDGGCQIGHIVSVQGQVIMHCIESNDMACILNKNYQEYLKNA